MPNPDRVSPRIGFVTGDFPLVTQTFIINQIADLREAGMDVQVFAYGRGHQDNLSSRFERTGIAHYTHYLVPPESKLRRLFDAAPTFFGLLRKNPKLAFSTINVFRYGRQAASLRLLYTVAPFVMHPVDVFHCHFGDIGKRFVEARKMLGLSQPFITTFYGIDVSKVFAEQGEDFYDELKRECSLYFVMSEDMKRRVVAHGFPEGKVHVHPVSIEVDSYPFSVRKLEEGQPIEIVSVGRMVEKKGFDDLLRALAIVRLKCRQSFCCRIVGGGPLEGELRGLAESLGLADTVQFEGAMQSDQIIRMFGSTHFMVQASKTARDGDRE